MKFSHIMILYNEERRGGEKEEEEEEEKKGTFRPPRLLTDKPVDREEKIKSCNNDNRLGG